MPCSFWGVKVAVTLEKCGYVKVKGCSLMKNQNMPYAWGCVGVFGWGVGGGGWESIDGRMRGYNRFQNSNIHMSYLWKKTLIILWYKSCALTDLFLARLSVVRRGNQQLVSPSRELMLLSDTSHSSSNTWFLTSGNYTQREWVGGNVHHFYQYFSLIMNSDIKNSFHTLYPFGGSNPGLRHDKTMLYKQAFPTATVSPELTPGCIPMFLERSQITFLEFY